MVHPYHFNWLKCIPFYSWVIFHHVYIPQLPIHSSYDGHLGCSHVLAIINSAAVNTGVHVSLSILVFPVYMPAVGLLGCMVVLVPVFKGISTLFSIVAVPVCIPTNNVRGFPFLYTKRFLCVLLENFHTCLGRSTIILL